MTEYRTELTPAQKELDNEPKARYTPNVVRYHAPNEHKAFKYEPVCVGCRENSPMIFKANCEGCRERNRLLAKAKGD